MSETPSSGLSHVRADGSAHMVDVSAKDVTKRQATATGVLRTRADVVERIGDSLGAPGCRSAADLLESWDPAGMSRRPWVVDLPT